MSDYSVHDYSLMIADEARTKGFVEALRRAVKPGAVVVELGTGTGFFAVLACQLGARQVHAIEPNDAIQVARDVARDNGCADRVRFVQAASVDVDLPERADVVISDMRGILPLYKQHVPAVIDARSRFLAPGGVLIGRRDVLCAAVVEAAELVEHLGLARARAPFGVDMEAARRLELNTFHRARIDAAELLAPAIGWATLDYATIASPDVRGDARWTIERDGTASGLLLWFDAELAEGIGLTNAPGQPELVYGSAFFPWPARVPVLAGDTVAASLQAKLVGDDYQWRWDCSVAAADGRSKAAFQQSTFMGAPLSPARLRRSAASHAASLGRDGRMTRFVLERMNGASTVGELATAVMTEFPGRFASWKDALTWVGELSLRYGD